MFELFELLIYIITVVTYVRTYDIIALYRDSWYINTSSDVFLKNYLIENYAENHMGNRERIHIYRRPDRKKNIAADRWIIMK